MCIAIQQPAGHFVGRDRLERLWDKNPDGGGFAYVDQTTGTIKVEKYMDKEEFITALLARWKEVGQEVGFLIHMRIATHGVVHLDNNHPFWVSETTVIAHNGVVSAFTPTKGLEAERSDTRILAEDFLAKLPTNWMQDEALCMGVGAILSTSKMIVLTTESQPSGNFFIFGQHYGSTKDGIWYSNTIGVAKPASWPTNIGSYASQHIMYPTKPHRAQTTTFPIGHIRALLVPQKKKGFFFDQVGIFLSKDKYIESKDLYGAYSRARTHLISVRSTELDIQGLLLFEEGEGWVCETCESVITTRDPECLCLEVVCADCYFFAADCACPGGIPGDYVYATDLNYPSRQAFWDDKDYPPDTLLGRPGKKTMDYSDEEYHDYVLAF